MNRIVLEDFTELHNNYYYAIDPEFAFCSSEKSGRAELLTQFTTCRETVAGELFAKVSGNLNDRRLPYADRIARVTSSRTCIALRLIRGWDAADLLYNPSRYTRERNKAMKLDETFPKSVESSLHMLNLIEDAYGWKKTIAKLATINKHNKPMQASGSAEIRAACFYADKRWMRSPYILSLFLLLIRAPFSTAKLVVSLNKVETLEDLLEALKTLAGRSGDSSHLRLVANHIPTIFDNFEMLFGRSFTKNYNPSAYKDGNSSSHYVGEGINALCKGRAANRKIAQTFAALGATKASKTTMEAAAEAL